MKPIVIGCFLFILPFICFSEDFKQIIDNSYENTYNLEYFQSSLVKLECYKVKLDTQYKQIDGLFSLDGLIELRDKIKNNAKVENDFGNSLLYEKSDNKVLVDNLMLSATSGMEFELKRFVFVYYENYILYFEMDYSNDITKIEDELFGLSYLKIRNSDIYFDDSKKYIWDYENKKESICLEKIRSNTTEIPEIQKWYNETSILLLKIKKIYYEN